MKTPALLGIFAMLAGSLAVSAATPKEEVTAAARKLAEQPNYTWNTTVVVPEGTRFRPGPVEGKANKDGLMIVATTFGDNTTHTVRQGEKGAITNQDGAWESLAEAESAEGFGRFRAALARGLQPAAQQAMELAADAKDLKKEGDVYSSELSEDGTKELLRIRRGGGGDAPEPRNAKGSVKFWLKDGVLAKYEFKVQGTITGRNGEDFEVDRLTTVEIKNVGTTKVEVPEGAKKKLG